MNIEEFKECLKKQVDGFPKAGVPDWVVATPPGVSVVPAERCGAGCGGFGRKAPVPGGRRGTPVVGGVGPCEDCGNAHRKRDGRFQ